MFERLTIKTDICIEPENEIVYHNPNDPGGMYNILDLAECLYIGGEVEAGILMEISRRLAAYEDSGLSPDEVLELKEEYETEKSNSEATYAIMCGLTEEVERLKKCLAEYEQAKADGRLVVLPCKVGEIVYVPTSQVCDDCIISGVIQYFVVYETFTDAAAIFNQGASDAFIAQVKTENIGKTVFLTREEAEAALAKEGQT